MEAKHNCIKPGTREEFQTLVITAGIDKSDHISIELRVLGDRITFFNPTMEFLDSLGEAIKSIRNTADINEHEKERLAQVLEDNPPRLESPTPKE